VPGSYNEFFDADASVNYNLSSKLTAYLNCNDLFNNRYYLFYINPGRLVHAGIRVRY
jgi:outer membrane receptor protein involved in Fe transport